MAENLKFRCKDSYSYKDYELNDENYGRLYTYYALQEACPKGWHIPSEAEWEELAKFVKEHKNARGIGTCLKADRSCWKCDEDTPLSTNQFGFSAWPAGYKDSLTFYHNQSEGAYFWSCTEDEDINKCEVWYLRYNSENLDSCFESKFFAASIRCIKDK